MKTSPADPAVLTVSIRNPELFDYSMNHKPSNPERFNGKGRVYDRCRPGYPPELLQQLIRDAALTPEIRVADIGAGTGIFTVALAEAGFRHIDAVEPNTEFRTRLAARFEGNPAVMVRDGTAEETGLPERSLDLITAAQAFHWFDRTRFRTECLRLARTPETVVALFWNCRIDDGGLYGETAELCRRYCQNFPGFSRPQPEAVLTEFFGEQGFRSIMTPHDLVYADAGEFAGRVLSSSYAPLPGEANYQLFLEELERLFAHYRENNLLRVANGTYCYYGCVQS